MTIGATQGSRARPCQAQVNDARKEGGATPAGGRRRENGGGRTASGEAAVETGRRLPSHDRAAGVRRRLRAGTHAAPLDGRKTTSVSTGTRRGARRCGASAPAGGRSSPAEAQPDPWPHRGATEHHHPEAGTTVDSLFAAGRRELSAGAVHVPGWLDPSLQRRLVAACREWARGPVPMRAAAMPGGRRMSVRTVCLGWHWQPYRYTRTAGDVNGARVAELPSWLADLGRSAVAAAFDDQAAGAGYAPDAALINFYDEHARMGMHRDADERSADPVVSLSLGDSCLFRFGNTETRTRPYKDVTLASGDVRLRRIRTPGISRRSEGLSEHGGPGDRPVGRPSEHHPTSHRAVAAQPGRTARGQGFDEPTER